MFLAFHQVAFEGCHPSSCRESKSTRRQTGRRKETKSGSAVDRRENQKRDRRNTFGRSFARLLKVMPRGFVRAMTSDTADLSSVIEGLVETHMRAANVEGTKTLNMGSLNQQINITAGIYIWQPHSRVESASVCGPPSLTSGFQCTYRSSRSGSATEASNLQSCNL